MREYHVRFRERFRGETPLYLLDSVPNRQPVFVREFVMTIKFQVFYKTLTPHL